MNVRCNKSTQLQLFFKYTLSREDEGSVYARNTIIERVTGIRVKESTVLNPNLDPGIIGKKRIILDVHVKDEQNRHFNIEMQTTYKLSLIHIYETFPQLAVIRQIHLQYISNRNQHLINKVQYLLIVF